MSLIGTIGVDPFGGRGFYPSRTAAAGVALICDLLDIAIITRRTIAREEGGDIITPIAPGDSDFLSPH